MQSNCSSKKKKSTHTTSAVSRQVFLLSPTEVSTLQIHPLKRPVPCPLSNSNYLTADTHYIAMKVLPQNKMLLYLTESGISFQRLSRLNLVFRTSCNTHKDDLVSTNIILNTFIFIMMSWYKLIWILFLRLGYLSEDPTDAHFKPSSSDTQPCSSVLNAINIRRLVFSGLRW